MTNRSYAALLGALLALAFAVGVGGVPFTPGCGWFTVVMLSLWTGLPWLNTRFRIGWRLVGFVAVSTGCAAFLARFLWANIDPANAPTVIAVGYCAHWAVLRTVATGPEMKKVVLAQNLCAAYVAMMWVFLQGRGIASDLASSSQRSFDARFLFWPPFLAVTLWAYTMLVKRNVKTMLFLAIAVAQPGIGFVDLQLIWGVPWGTAAAGLCAVACLGIGIWCLKLDRTEERRAP